jgi:hypothetical protein
MVTRNVDILPQQYTYHNPEDLSLILHALKNLKSRKFHAWFLHARTVQTKARQKNLTFHLPQSQCITGTNCRDHEQALYSEPCSILFESRLNSRQSSFSCFSSVSSSECGDTRPAFNQITRVCPSRSLPTHYSRIIRCYVTSGDETA